MKGKIKLERPPSYKLLQGQSQKLKDKLQNLRQQIKIKKQQKEMNKTVQSMGSYPTNKNNSKQKMNNTSYAQKEEKDKQLSFVLTEMKMENIEPKLKEKNIVKIEQLINTTEEEIDKWKDVPVGYRIKLKKFIQKNKHKVVPPLNVLSKQGEIPSTDSSKQKNIEEIIKNRKAQKRFVPINREYEDTQQQFQPELEEDQQQKMMLSILEVISVKQRASCLKKTTKKERENLKMVHWSPKVDEWQKNHTANRTYPKQTISKSVFHISSEMMQKQASQNASYPKQSSFNFQGEYPNYKYCWSCLKRINLKSSSTAQRLFCGRQCEQKYEQVVNPLDLLKQIEQTQIQYRTVAKQKIQTNEGEVDFDIV